MSKCIIVTLQINNILLKQVNNANILKTIGMLYNAILL